jgi:hypothetical protein
MKTFNQYILTEGVNVYVKKGVKFHKNPTPPELKKLTWKWGELHGVYVKGDTYFWSKIGVNPNSAMSLLGFDAGTKPDAHVVLSTFLHHTKTNDKVKNGLLDKGRIAVDTISGKIRGKRYKTKPFEGNTLELDV